MDAKSDKQRVGELRAESSRLRNDLAHVLASAGVEVVRLPGDRVLRLTENVSCKTIRAEHLVDALRSAVEKYRDSSLPGMHVHLMCESSSMLRESVQTRRHAGEVFAASSAASKRKGREGPPVEGCLEDLPGWVSETAARLIETKADLVETGRRLKAQRSEATTRAPPWQSNDSSTAEPPTAAIVSPRKRVLLKEADAILAEIVSNILVDGGRCCFDWQSVEGAVVAAVNAAFSAPDPLPR